MRLVVLESPFAGDVAGNIEYARRCVHDCLMRGDSPIASHLLYTQEGVLDDNVPEQRQLGIDAGLAWVRVSEATVVYVDRGLTRGMAYGVHSALAAGRTVEFRSLSSEKPALANVEFERSANEAVISLNDRLADKFLVVTWDGLLSSIPTLGPRERFTSQLFVTRDRALQLLSENSLKPFLEIEQDCALFKAGIIGSLYKVKVIVTDFLDGSFSAAHATVASDFTCVETNVFAACS